MTKQNIVLERYPVYGQSHYREKRIMILSQAAGLAERLLEKLEQFGLILQGIVFDKVRPYLPEIFRLQEARFAVKDDIRRAWAWSGTLAYNITEKKEAPHRTFDFDTNGLLKLGL